jgi:hypothetical protein
MVTMEHSVVPVVPVVPAVPGSAVPVVPVVPGFAVSVGPGSNCPTKGQPHWPVGKQVTVREVMGYSPWYSHCIHTVYMLLTTPTTHHTYYSQVLRSPPPQQQLRLLRRGIRAAGRPARLPGGVGAEVNGTSLTMLQLHAVYSSRSPARVQLERPLVALRDVQSTHRCSTVHYALHTMHCTLCTVHYALHTARYSALALMSYR